MRIKSFTHCLVQSIPVVITAIGASLIPGVLSAQTADLQVVSVSNTTSPFVPGTDETFSITVQNNGPDAAPGAIVNFELFDFPSFLAAVGGDADWVFSQSNGYTFARSNPMPSGLTETFTVTLTIPSNAAFLSDGVAFDAYYATISAAVTDPNTGNNYNYGSLTSQAQASLGITKTLLTPNVSQGGTAVYEIAVSNSGPSDIGGIAVNDALGANLMGGTLVLSSNAGNLYVPRGGNIKVYATATVNPAALVGANFSNTASLNTAGATGGPGTNTAPSVTAGAPSTNSSGVVTNALPTADVEVVEVRHTTGPVVPGTLEHFEVDVRNNGAAEANGVVLTTVLLGLQGTIINGPIGAWVSQSNGGVFTRTSPMPAGALETVYFDILIDKDAHYESNVSPYFWATVSSSNPDPNTANNTKNITLQEQIQANLTIDKKLLIPQVSQGGTAIYEISVCNTGPSDVAGIAVTDVPGANLVLASLTLGPNANNLYVGAGECAVLTATATVDPAAPVGSNFGNMANVDVSGLVLGASNLPAVINAPSDIDTSGIVVNALPAADLEMVSVTLNSGPIVPGTSENFSFTVRNNGPAEANGVTVVFSLLDAEWQFDDAGFPGAWSTTNGHVFIRATPMPSGAEETISFSLFIPSDAAMKAHDPFGPMVAFVGGANPDPNLANNYVLNYDEPTQAQASLTLQKTLLTPQVAQGGTALYELTVCNNGPSDIGGIALNDLPGANLDAGTLVLSADAGNLRVQAGQCVNILASVRVSAAAPVGSNFVNSASLNGASAYGGPGTNMPPVVNLPAPVNNGVGVVINALPAADVQMVSVTLNTAPIVPGTSENFSFTVRNNGPADANGLTVVFSLLDADWVFDDAGFPDNWSTVNGHVFVRANPLASGAEETLSFNLFFHSDAATKAGDPFGPIVAYVAGANPDPNVANNYVINYDVPTEAQANLSITKQLLTPNLAPGGTALYEVTLCNSGPSDIRGIAINDIPGLNLVPGSVVMSSDAGDLNVRANSCVDVLISVEVDPSALVGSNFENEACVDASGAYGGPGTNSPPVVNEPCDTDDAGLITYDISQDADLAVTTFTLDNGPIVPGTSASFTITVENMGPGVAYGAAFNISLTDINWFEDNSTSPADWSFIGSGTWLKTTPMEPGEVATFSVQLGIPADAAYNAFDGLGPAFVTAASASPDPNSSNNTASLSLSTQVQASLTIDKHLLTPEVAPGGYAFYEITICNNGPSDIDGIGISDIPGINLNAMSLQLSPDATSMYIPDGQCVDVLAVVKVADNAVVGANFANTATVDLTNVDGGPGSTMAPSANTPSDTDDSGVVSDYLPVANLSIEVVETPGPDPAYSGGQYEFDINVTNEGPAPAEHVVAHDIIHGLPGWTFINSFILNPDWAWDGNGITVSRQGAMPVGTETVAHFVIGIPLNTVPGIKNHYAKATAANPGTSTPFVETFEVLDTIPPEYLNCPTNPIVVAADVDQCSAIVNWPMPIAIDNQELVSNLQISGPPNGQEIPVGPPQVVTYKATDASGNMAFCTFTVQVIDTQDPELAGGFPLDEYVSCEAVPPPFPLTVEDFVDNCPGPLTLEFNETSDQGADPSMCDYYNYEITRIWTVTDQSGNMRDFEQNIFVSDTTAPEFTVNDVLISCDMVDQAPGIVDTSDNCAENAYLTIDSFDVSTQDPSIDSCAHYTYTIFRTWTVTDPCGNSTVKVQTINVQDIEPPVIECQDVTVELDENGVVIFSGNDALANVEDNCAPDEALIVTVIGGNELTCDDLGTSVHTIMVADPCGNASFCDVNITVVDLLPPIVECPDPQVFNLDGGECLVFLTPANLPVYSDNCTATIEYDPPIDGGVPIGINIITATVTDQSGNTASCTFEIDVIGYTPQSNSIACNDQIQVSLGPDCQAVINADMVLEGHDYYCYDDYCIYITDAQGDTVENNTFTLADVGQCFTVTVQDCSNSQNSCWGIICVEEKLNPEIECPADITVACNESTDTDTTGVPVVLSCESSVTMDYEDVITDNGACGEPRVLIERTWTVTDASGNSSTCVQNITVQKFDPSILEFPADILSYSCAEVSENPDLLLPSHSGLPTLNGAPIFGDHYCEVFVGYWDETAIDANCATNYTLLRHWLVLDQCLPYEEGVNPIRHVQLIRVMDELQPNIVCPADLTVSTSPWSCYATVDLPVPEIYDACSELESFTVSASSGNVIHYGGTAYSLTNLEVGTHTVTYVTKDQCNNIGYCQFSITVVDDIPPTPVCDEHSVVTLTTDDPLNQGLTKIYAETFDDGSYDNCGPVTFLARRMDSCIDFDWIGPNGEYPNNDGGLPESIDKGLTFQPWVPFACCDVGSTIMVELRVTDQYGNINSCMVEVEVQDKLPPFIECPPDITLSCDYWFDGHETNGFEETDGLESIFGRVLDAYDYAESDRAEITINDPGNTSVSQPHTWGIDGWADDNCDVDISVRTRIFDDCSGDQLPSGGPDHAVRLVERTFRAQDGQGNTSTCRQRIWVQDFDPFYITDTQCGLNNADDVRWPCDLTLTDCPGGYLTPENLSAYAPNNAPVVNDDNCSLVGVTYEDQVFYFVDNACYKIIRTWTVIDWCQFDPVEHTGYWTYVQVIKVHDENGPEFENCPDAPVTLCTADSNVVLPDNNQVFLGESDPNSSKCSVHVWMTQKVHETCSDVVIYDVKIYPFNGTDYVQIVAPTNAPVDSNGEAVLSFDTRQNSLPPNNPIRKYGLPYNNRVCSNWPLPGGTKDYHRVLWSVEDGCGNQSTCSYLFRLEDCKQPTPVCVGLSTVVMPSSGSVTIWAADFDSGSSVDDCTSHDDLLFSFSGDSYEPSRVFDCDAIEANGSPSFLVEIWVADEGNDQNCNGFVQPLGIEWSERNKDYCTSFIVVDDNENVCGDGFGGTVETEDNDAVGQVNMDLTNPSTGEVVASYTTASNGLYFFLNPLLGYKVTAKRNDDHKNGVSTLDLVKIQKHLLGIELLDSPYKLIAADVNNNQSISALDLVELRKLVLGIYTEFPNNQSWRFVDSEYEFEDPTHPWPFAEIMNVDGMTMGHDFVGIKVGDVNGNAVANATQVEVRNTTGVLDFTTDLQTVKAGQTVEVPVRADNFNQIIGYQFTLNTAGLQLKGVEAGALPVTMENVGIHPNAITMSWNDVHAVSVNNDVLFTLTFDAIETGSLDKMLSIVQHSKLTESEAYNGTEDLLDVALKFTSSQKPGEEYALFQNEPNPFSDGTVIGFTLPKAMTAKMTFSDITGRVLKVIDQEFNAGYNEVMISQRDLAHFGMIYYQLHAGDFTATKKMILVK